jgi:hypothetical protein
MNVASASSVTGASVESNASTAVRPGKRSPRRGAAAPGASGGRRSPAATRTRLTAALTSARACEQVPLESVPGGGGAAAAPVSGCRSRRAGAGTCRTLLVGSSCAASAPLACQAPDSAPAEPRSVGRSRGALVLTAARACQRRLAPAAGAAARCCQAGHPGTRRQRWAAAAPAAGARTRGGGARGAAPVRREGMGSRRRGMRPSKGGTRWGLQAGAVGLSVGRFMGVWAVPRRARPLLCAPRARRGCRGRGGPPGAAGIPRSRRR